MRPSVAPPVLADLAQRLGVGGRRVRLRAGEPERSPVLLQFLEEGEGTLYRAGDARAARLKKEWGTIRARRAETGLSVGTIHAHRARALRELQRFWAGGEAERVAGARRIGGQRGVQRYRAMRGEIAAGRMPEGERELMELAFESVSAAWWKRHSPGERRSYIEELSYLGTMMLHGRWDVYQLAGLLGCRLGLSRRQALRLYDELRRGQDRAVQDCQREVAA